MPTPASPPNPAPQGGAVPPAGGEPAGPSHIDHQLHAFWQRNGQSIAVMCGLVLLFYVGKAGWDYLAGQREAGLEAEFSAAVTPDQLQAFAAAHPGHVLSGMALLENADNAYASGRMDAAISGYSGAAAALKGGPLAGRAQLGLAMARIQSGAAAEGAAGLRLLADDPRQFHAIRAEALYQMASLASAAGKADEVRKLSLELMQVDPNSPWAQRAFALQAQAPGTGGGPAVSFRPAGK